MKMKSIVVALGLIGFAVPAFATNGMTMEGYGPIATGVGGAAIAFDNGTGGMATNPATLGMMASGTSRLDIAAGILQPDVNAKMAGQPDVKSGGDSYLMPAVGYIRKDGNLAWGIGVVAIGGMGTEYAAGSFMSAGSLDKTRSELGVGRVVFPLAYNVNQDFTIGGSIDFVWATLDMKFAAQATTLGGLVTAGSGAIVGAAGLGAPFPPGTWARVDFSDDNDFSGAAKGSGWAGKIGFTYRMSPAVTIGGIYQSKTSLSDLETGSSGAALTAGPPAGAAFFADSGKIKVVNFQWPEIYGLGIAFQASPSWLLVGDVKHIGWSDVMKNFNMTYESGGLGGSVSFALPQNWSDQTVLSLGAAYKYNDAMTLRFGLSTTKNPIPDSTLNALFPAIEKNHYTFGLGYSFSKASELNASFVYAPKVTQTSASGITNEHSQSNWQVMYSHRF